MYNNNFYPFVEIPNYCTYFYQMPNETLPFMQMPAYFSTPSDIPSSSQPVTEEFFPTTQINALNQSESTNEKIKITDHDSSSE